MNDEVVDQRCKNVAEQNRQHDAFRECWVDDSNQDRHESDQGAIDPFALFGHRGTDRVGRHEHEPESQSSDHQVPVEGDAKHRIGAGVGEVVLFDLDNTSSNEPCFHNIADPQRSVPDLTRRNVDDLDMASARMVSVADVLYQDLVEVIKMDKKLFWQGAVQVSWSTACLGISFVIC